MNRSSPEAICYLHAFYWQQQQGLPRMTSYARLTRKPDVDYERG